MYSIYLQIKNVHVFLVRDIYYKDVKFTTGHSLVLTETETRRCYREFVDRSDVLLAVNALPAIAREMVPWTQLRNDIMNNNNNNGPRTTTWTYTRMKRKIVYYLTPRDGRPPTARSMSCLAIADDNDFSSMYVAATTRLKLSTSRDDRARTRAALCVFDYAIRTAVKQYWKHDIVDKLITSERNNSRLAMLQRVTTSKRWLSFDIEVDYVPHERKVETITMIGTTLFDHAHDVPIEHRLFTRIASRRSEQTKEQINNNMSVDPIIEMCFKTSCQRLGMTSRLHTDTVLEMLPIFISPCHKRFLTNMIEDFSCREVNSITIIEPRAIRGGNNDDEQDGSGNWFYDDDDDDNRA